MKKNKVSLNDHQDYCYRCNAISSSSKKNSCIIEYIHDTCRSKYTYFKYTLYYVWNYSFLLVEIDVECIDFEFPLVKIPDMSLFGKCM